jgi:16S rRNA (cytosine967-C5)-methyltransferase
LRDGGRLSAAIQVLSDIESNRRPVRLALKAWGDSARYAGAKDRAWVSGLVLDVLRRQRSLAWRMGEESPRALAVAALGLLWGWPLERIAEAASDEPHGPGPLTDAERAALAAPRDLADAPAPVRGDYPDWLDAELERAFGEDRVAQAEALAQRAPVDLRANRLKTGPGKALKALEPLPVRMTGVLPEALRIEAPRADERAAAVEAMPAFVKGWVEVQDLGSQIAAACAGEVKGKQVLDLCAGGGGKTLALAGAMENTGQIYAYDSDARRLTDTIRRGERAGVRNLQVRSPVKPDALKGLDGRMDLVFVDAPCSGTGSWRRHPDTKWRLTPQALERRTADQDTVLDLATTFVKPSGRIVYVTCSVLPAEDEDRVAAFLGRHPQFEPVAATDDPLLARWLTPEGYLRLSPKIASTDGFFVAVLARRDDRQPKSS